MQQVLDQARHRLDHMFAVVEHEQQPLGAERRGQALG